MGSVVNGTIHGLGNRYADGIERMEIWIDSDRANGLPYSYGHRIPIVLQINGVHYHAGLRATVNNDYVWISPDLKSEDGVADKLAYVLTKAGFNKNDKVILITDGKNIVLTAAVLQERHEIHVEQFVQGATSSDGQAAIPPPLSESAEENHGRTCTEQSPAEIEQLWESSDPAAWQLALDRYWHHVKRSNLALEHEMEALEPSVVRQLDADQWYDWLLNKYFVWKYTDIRRYRSTTKHLKRHAQESGRQDLLAIRDRILAAEHFRIQDALRTARQIGGLGTAGASGLLALLFPTKFGTVDQFALCSLLKIRHLPERDLLKRMKPNALTIANGVLLIEIMRRKAFALNALFLTNGWTPRKIDMVLWASERKWESMGSDSIEFSPHPEGK